MTVFSVRAELEPELIRFGRVLARASIFFMKNLGDIIDVRSLRAGDEEYDYFLEVPADQVNAVRRQVAALQRTILNQFGTEISVKTKPVQG
ncbi:MAG TPA: hypothetical protein VGD01_08865 [Candidatus Elarobacter sp.]|jgi:hypothetical protein